MLALCPNCGSSLDSEGYCTNSSCKYSEEQGDKKDGHGPSFPPNDE